MRFRFTRGQRTPLLADLALVISSTVLGPRSCPSTIWQSCLFGAQRIEGLWLRKADWERGF